MSKQNAFFILLIFLGLSIGAKAQDTFFDVNSAQKNELKITPEMTKMVENSICMFLKNIPEEMLKNYGIKNMSQLLNAQLGTPIPMYVINNQDLKFTGMWRLPVLSDDEFIAFYKFKLHFV